MTLGAVLYALGGIGWVVWECSSDSSLRTSVWRPPRLAFGTITSSAEAIKVAAGTAGLFVC